MAFPDNGFIKIYPDNVTVVSGRYSLNSDVPPQAVVSDATIDAYYDARVTNLAVAPCIIREAEVPPASGFFVPNVGDHELSFSASTRGLEFYDGSYPSAPVATLDYLSKDFPPGMTLNQIMVAWTGQQLFGPNRDRSIVDIKFNFFGSTVHTLTFAAGLLTGTAFSPSNAIVSSLLNWSPLQAFKPFGITIPVLNVLSANLGENRSIMSECFLLASYNTAHFSFNNATPLAIPGEIVDITDPSETLGLFEDYKIYWDTNEDLGEEDGDIPGLTGGVIIPRFFIRTDGRIRFQIPKDLGIPYGGRRLILYGVTDGIIYSGEIQIAQLNVLLVDGSGVYQLTDGRRHDTYYNRGTTPITEIDLKFPRPNFKTGLF